MAAAKTLIEMNYAHEVSGDSDENLTKGVTPECLNRGASSGLAGIPDGSRTLPSQGNRGIEAFGNDGLYEVWDLPKQLFIS